jgi:hypothetical protein
MNIPGGRMGPAIATDRLGNAYMFGGWGYDMNGRYGSINPIIF